MYGIMRLKIILETITDLIEIFQAEQIVEIIGRNAVLCCTVLQALATNTFTL